MNDEHYGYMVLNVKHGSFKESLVMAIFTALFSIRLGLSANARAFDERCSMRHCYCEALPGQPSD